MAEQEKSPPPTPHADAPASQSNAVATVARPDAPAPAAGGLESDVGPSPHGRAAAEEPTAADPPEGGAEHLDHHDGHGDHGDHGDHGAHPTPRQRLLRLLSVESSDVWIVVIYAATIGLLSLATPIAVQSLINQVSFGVLLQPVVVLTLMLLAGLLLVGVLRMLQTSVIELLQVRLFVRLGADVVARLIGRGYHALDRQDGREILTRFFDIVTVQKATAGLLLEGLGIVLQVLIGLFILAFYHPILLAFAAALLFCVTIVMFVLGRGAVSTAIAESRAKYAVTDWLSQVMYQPLAFKGGHGPALAVSRTDALLHGYISARRAHFRVLLRQIGGLLLIEALASAALLGIGGALVIGRQLTIGQLVASEIIVSGVLAGLAKFGKHLESLYDLLASLDKIGHLLSVRQEPQEGPVRMPFRRPDDGLGGMRVRLHDVTLAYPDQAPLLQDVHLTIEPGESVAIVGPTGSGKSLFAEALYGLLPIPRGLIEFDGHALRDLNLPSLRRQVALLRGDVSEIFSGTLEENLRCGHNGATIAELRQVLSAVGLWDEWQSEPQGLRRLIHSGGPTLSERERQRLLAARALLLRPRLLLIDGVALSHVEQDGDWLNTLMHAKGGPTVVLCAPLGSPLSLRCTRQFQIVDGRLLPSDGSQTPPSPAKGESHGAHRA